MSVSDFYNKTAVVKRPTRAKDSVSSYTETEITIYSALKCKVDLLSGKEQFIDAKNDSVITHRIYCSTSAAIQKKDLFYVGGLKIRVVAVRDIDLVGRFLTIDATSVDSEKP